MANRIYYAIPALSGGGAEAQIRYLANAFAEQGYSVTLFFLYPSAAPVKFHERVELVQLCYFRSNVLNAFLTFCFLFFRLRRNDPVVTAGLYFDLIVGALSFMVSFRWILRESNAAEARSNSLKNRLRARLGCRATSIIANSISGARYWSDAGAVNTEVIFNGYPDSLLRKSGARVKKERVVLCASRMQPHKRVDVSLRYFEQVFGPHPEWRLIVVGSGPEGQLIDGLVASSPFSDRIERLNEIPQTHVFELMSRAQFILNFSTHEGTPNVIIEALAHGCVPILSDTRSHREFFTDDFVFFRTVSDSFEQADYIALTDELTLKKLSDVAKQNLKSWRIRNAFESYRRIIGI